jgi:hypothetical protein
VVKYLVGDRRELIDLLAGEHVDEVPAHRIPIWLGTFGDRVLR